MRDASEPEVRRLAAAGGTPSASGPVLFTLLLLPILLGLAGASSLGELPAHRGLGQALLGIASLAWLAAVGLSGGIQESRAVRWVVLSGALALRLSLAFGSLALSDDVYRYVWEGGLVSEGQSPYARAPSDPGLATWSSRWGAIHRRVNHPEVSAAYPPLAQLLFAGVVIASGGPEAQEGRSAVGGMRLAFTLADLAVLALLLHGLRRSGASSARAVLWGWSPLICLEFAGGGHFDSLGIALLLGALLCLGRAGRPDPSGWAEGWSFVLLGAGTLVKLLPAALLPISLRRARRPALGLALFLLVSFLGALPLLLLDGGVRGALAGLAEYGRRWESFSLLFRPLARAVAAFAAGPGARLALDPDLLERALVLTAWGGVVVLAWRRGLDPIRAARLTIGAFLLLTPTLHPWYLAWLVPFLAFVPSRAWTVLLAAAPVLYWPLTEWQARAEWVEPAWLWPAVALPFLALLALESLALARRARPELHQPRDRMRRP